MKVLLRLLSRETFVCSFALVAVNLLVAISSTSAAPIQLLSIRNPLVAAQTGGNGDSISPILSDTHRFVVFSNSPNDLVPDDTNGIPDVFVRDLTTQTITLIGAGVTAPTMKPVGHGRQFRE